MDIIIPVIQEKLHKKLDCATLIELDFCLHLKLLVGLPLGIALSLIANKAMITINLLAGLVPLRHF